MASKGGSAPPAPDPVATANAQTASNLETAEAQARLNRINEISPFGNVTYTRTGGAPGTMQAQPVSMTPTTPGERPAFDPRWNLPRESWERNGVDPAAYEAWATSGAASGSGGSAGGSTGYGSGTEPSTYTRTTALSPEQQAILESQQRTGLGLSELAGESVGRVRSAMATPLSYEGLPDLTTDFSGDRQKVEDALYSRHASRLDPQFEQDRKALEDQLYNQGVRPGSKAWQNAVSMFDRGRNDAYSGARMDATSAGGAEQSRLYGLSADARQRLLGERIFDRSLPINEVATLMGTAGPIQAPNFGPVPQVGVPSTDVAGNIWNAYQGQQNIYNQNQANSRANIGALASLGGTLGAGWIMSSDPDLKDDAGMADGADVLRKIEKLPVHLWSYKAETGMGTKPRIGPMADDWAESFGGDGETIDIASALGASLAGVKALAKRLKQVEARA